MLSGASAFWNASLHSGNGGWDPLGLSLSLPFGTDDPPIEEGEQPPGLVGDQFMSGQELSLEGAIRQAGQAGM